MAGARHGMFELALRGGSTEPVSSDDKTNQEIKDSVRLFKIRPVYEYIRQKFKSIKLFL
jgi:hypothetical protein